MNFKIIQIAVDNDKLYALSNDGRMYWYGVDGNGETDWHEVETLQIVEK